MTTAEWLFNIPVTWIVPQYVVWSDFQVEEEGLFLPEDEDDQNALVNRRIMYTIPTAAMAELFADKEMSLAISDPYQAKEVYEHIMKHLANWRNKLSRPQLGSVEVPMEGLREFNNLAKALFNPANTHHYAMQHKNNKVLGVRALLGMPNVPQADSVMYNGTIMIDIENRVKALNSGRFNFWEHEGNTH
tara:strand:+ start:82 stop:648 length:567 start_codon:yes stop_codon:yes gene_type:complete